MKKHILIFSIAYVPYVGGAEIAIKEVTDRLLHYEFDMITIRYDSVLPRIEKIGNITVHRIGWGKQHPTEKDMISFPLYINKIFFPILASLEAVRLSQKKTFNIVWSVISYAGFPALFFKIFYHSTPFVLSLQDGDTIQHVTKRFRIRIVWPLYRLIFRKARAIHAISNYLAGFGRTMGARDTSVIPNGVDSVLFKEKETLEKGELSLRDRLGISEEDTVLLSVSRLVPKNGLFYLLQALRYLAPTTKLILVGDGPLRSELKTFAKKIGVEEMIIFVGFIPYYELPPYYTIADVFIRPSLSEGFGNVFLEAMASGVPVVATPVGGITDIVSHGTTGFLCDLKNPEDIARSVRYILDDKNAVHVEQVIKNALKMTSHAYTWDVVAGKMDRLFQNVL